MKRTLFSIEQNIPQSSEFSSIEDQIQPLLEQMHKLRETINGHIKTKLSIPNITFHSKQYTRLRAQYYVLSQLILRLKAGEAFANAIETPFKPFVFTNIDIALNKKSIKRITLPDHMLRKIMEQNANPYGTAIIELWNHLKTLTKQSTPLPKHY